MRRPSVNAAAGCLNSSWRTSYVFWQRLNLIHGFQHLEQLARCCWTFLPIAFCAGRANQLANLLHISSGMFGTEPESILVTTLNQDFAPTFESVQPLILCSTRSLQLSERCGDRFNVYGAQMFGEILHLSFAGHMPRDTLCALRDTTNIVGQRDFRQLTSAQADQLAGNVQYLLRLALAFGLARRQIIGKVLLIYWEIR